MMPAWIHDRASHIQRHNPSMPKSEAFAIATQQSHATGHTPKGYGTPTGKRVAKKKYDEPMRDYKQIANPSHKSKSAGIDVAVLKGFTDELTKIAISTTPGKVAALASPKLSMAKPRATSMPRDAMNPGLALQTPASPAPLSTSVG